MKHFRPHSFGPHSPLPSRLPHVDPLACRDLWTAVLITALRDLCDPQPRSSVRAAAERWVGTWPGRKFRAVCTMAGMDPRQVHRSMTALMALPVAERRRCLLRVERPTGTARGPEPDVALKGNPSFGDPNPPDTPDLVPISRDARCNRVAAMFARGVTPSDMPQAFATEGHAVSMSQVWNDIRHLRAAGRIGYLREPRAPHHTAMSGRGA